MRQVQAVRLPEGVRRGKGISKECDIYGTPTVERVQKIKAMEKYMTKVDKYRKEEKKTR